MQRIADFTAVAGGKYLDVAPASVKIVSQGYTISEFEDASIRLPNVYVYGVATIQLWRAVEICILPFRLCPCSAN